MAFSPESFHQTHSSAPPFHLLRDLEHYWRQFGGHPTQWQPKFDVYETADAYELHGELPGVNKENFTVDFTGPDTMLIRGKVERPYTASTPPTNGLGDAAVAGAINAEDLKGSDQDPGRDEGTTSTRGRISGEAFKKHHEKTSYHQVKYWRAERNIGQFCRSFNFPSQVDKENINAIFKDGMLSITVPKSTKHEFRHITIN